ncbi:UNVERIFIED_CONTAM: hypothetical protein PYX00_010733 [Menopon gallinae]|uniref:Uncharacterized protein n=1 Tax=Menopon gallinae TaxID=328185 RepID=A0AAW2HGX3_9NEOP
MLAFAVKPSRVRGGARTASSSGESVTIPSITAACRCGSSRTTGVLFVSRSGPFREWGSNVFFFRAP